MRALTYVLIVHIFKVKQVLLDGGGWCYDSMINTAGCNQQSSHSNEAASGWVVYRILQY